MTPLEIFSICSGAVALTMIPVGICACVVYLHCIACELRTIRKVLQARKGMSPADAAAYLASIQRRAS